MSSVQQTEVTEDLALPEKLDYKFVLKVVNSVGWYVYNKPPTTPRHETALLVLTVLSNVENVTFTSGQCKQLFYKLISELGLVITQRYNLATATKILKWNERLSVLCEVITNKWLEVY